MRIKEANNGVIPPRTVCLRLEDPNKRLRKKVENYMKKCRAIARMVSERMPSIPYRHWGTSRSKVWTRLVKDVRERDVLEKGGMDISHDIALRVILKVRTMYYNWAKAGRPGDGPIFRKASWIPYHRRHPQVREDEKGFTLSLPFGGGRKARETFRFYPSDYQDEILSSLVNGKIEHAGKPELVKYKDFLSFNLPLRVGADLDYEAKSLVGVDLGPNVIAWAVAMDERENFLGEVHFDGGQAGWVRDYYNRKRRDLQKDGKMEVVRELKDKESRWMKNKNHNVSRRIVEFAGDLEDPVIFLENINMNGLRGRVDNPKIHSWQAGDLRDMIVYKGLQASIRVYLVPSAYTSQKCPKCGYISGKNRRGVHFKCQKCSYTNHADFVGAWNIARSVLS